MPTTDRQQGSLGFVRACVDSDRIRNVPKFGTMNKVVSKVQEIDLKVDEIRASIADCSNISCVMNSVDAVLDEFYDTGLRVRDVPSVSLVSAIDTTSKNDFINKVPDLSQGQAGQFVYVGDSLYFRSENGWNKVHMSLKTHM